MKVSRRSVMIGGGLAGAVLGTGAGALLLRAESTPATIIEPTSTAVHLQITAHPDDDLYFFNPDLAQAIRAGAASTTVCLTAGEADGKNLPGNDPRFDGAETRYVEYAAARYAGLRMAYAHIITGDKDSPWQRRMYNMPKRQAAEEWRLVKAPHVRLVFLNMWQEGSRSGAGQSRLSQLWTGDVKTHPTLIPLGSGLTQASKYTRDDLIEALLSMLVETQPTVVRTMDPDPDRQVHNAENPQYADFGDYSDHIDHTPAGLFALEALHRWWANGGGAGVALEAYRGYFNRRWPVNLSRAQSAEKFQQIAVYGLMDRKVGSSPSSHAQSTHHRYAVGSNWLGSDAEGGLAAFGVLGGQARMWRFSATTGAWSDAVPIPHTNSVLPHLSVLAHPDGRFQLFGVTAILNADSASQRRDVITTVQNRPGGDFAPWEVLGNPDPPTSADPARHRGIGMPAAVSTEDGQIYLFVRDLRAGVAYRSRRPGSGWTAWSILEPGETRDGLTASTASDGSVIVVATSKTGVAQWRQDGRRAAFRLERSRITPSADPPLLLRRHDKNLVLITRERDSANVIAYEQTARGEWNPSRVTLGGNGGFGPIAGAIGRDGRLALAHRNAYGSVSFSLRNAERLDDATWLSGGPLIVCAPAVAFDSENRLVVAAFGVDGKLWWARQPTAESAAWTWNSRA